MPWIRRNTFEEEGSSGVGDGTEPGKEEKEGTAQTVQDSAFLTALDQKIDRLLNLFDEAAKEKTEEDPMDAAIRKLEGKEEEKRGKEGSQSSSGRGERWTGPYSGQGFGRCFF